MGIAYLQSEEINTELCLQKLALAHEDEVPLPENIHVQTTLTWDNIDRLEETFTIAGTSHRVNAIAIQDTHFGPILPQTPGIEEAKTKKRSIHPSISLTVQPPYNTGEGCGRRASICRGNI